MSDLEDEERDYNQGWSDACAHANELVAKAKALVDVIDDAERNQGGLLSVQALRGRDELRLELSKWK